MFGLAMITHFGRLTTKQFTHGEGGFKIKVELMRPHAHPTFKENTLNTFPRLKGQILSNKLSEFEITTRFTDF